LDLTYRKTLQDLRSEKVQYQRIFFYRICGTGMGAAACLLKEKGFEVEGGDIQFSPPMSDYLRKTAIPCIDLAPLSRAYLQTFDLIIVGNVVGRQSAAARMLEQLGVPFTSFPAALGAFILQDQPVIGIAGTHGKTTTTYLMTQLFEQLGQSPGYFLGGVLPDRAPTRLGDGSGFFIESDEYDSAYFEKIAKFRLYSLNHLVLTALEFDHADIYADISAIQEEFRVILPELTHGLIASADYAAAKRLYKEFIDRFPDRFHCLFGEKARLGPHIQSITPQGSRFTLNLGDKSYSFHTNLIGRHNVLNLAPCILWAHQQGHAPESIQTAVKQLKMVKRRQEPRGKFQGALVIDDFAHHPRAVAMTIEAIRQQYPEKQLCVVIEPASATARSDLFQSEFTAALANADCIILIQPQRDTTVKQARNIDCQKIAADLQTQGKPAQVVRAQDQLLTLLQKHADEDTILLILSNGTCLGLWESDFTKDLQK